MATFGQRVIEKVGSRYSVSADGNPDVKAAGVTVAWATITAASVDAVVLPSYGSTVNTAFSDYNQGADSYVTAGEKYLRLGTVLCKISGGTYAGKFAPYGTAGGSLGGGTLLKTKGNMYILNRTVFEKDSGSDHSPVIEGGKIWKARVVGFAGSADTSAGPTTAEFEAAFPNCMYVE